MAKRARFIAPVEVLQGNLSGKQDLKYPSNDNKAYEAPAGVNYARNYTTRYIGAYRAKDGLKYFAVKQRSAVKISATTKLNMALLGATMSIMAVLRKDTTFMAKLGPSWQVAKVSGLIDESTTIEKFMRDKIRTALASKAMYISWNQTAAGTPVCTNPFVYVSGASAGVTIVELSAKILREFWGALATSPIEFKVNSALKGVAHVGNTFGELINSKFNVLGLQAEDVYIVLPGGENPYQVVGQGEGSDWAVVSHSSTITATNYTTHDVEID